MKWVNGNKARYKNAAIDITKRIVAAYFEDKTIVIPFENVSMIERMEGEDNEIPSDY